MARTWPLITALIISGCAGDEPPLTKFNQLSESEFMFTARTDLEYPENDPKAEATRMAWLERALSDRHLCPSGHTIIGRTVVAVDEEELRQTHHIVYHVVCNWTEPLLLKARSDARWESGLVFRNEVRLLLHDGAGLAHKMQQTFGF